MTTVQPFRLYAESELRAIETGLKAVAAQWWLDWGGEPCHDVMITLRPVCLRDIEQPQWLLAADQQVAFCVDHTLYAGLSRLCLRQEKSSAGLTGSCLAKPVLMSALAALAAGLGVSSAAEIHAEPLLMDAQLPSACSAVGALHVCLRISWMCIVLILPCNVVTKCLPAAPVLAPLPALRLGALPLDAQICLNVMATATQITLGDLASIQAGDVIQLDHRVGQAFDLQLPDGQTLGVVEYGRNQQHAVAKITLASTQNRK
jgi:hypothetical protein